MNGKAKSGIIRGLPENEEYDYEFTVVTSLPGGDYQFHSHHEYADEAYKVAEEIGGIVVHNVRVSHKKKKRGYYVYDENNI